MDGGPRLANAVNHMRRGILRIYVDSNVGIITIIVEACRIVLACEISGTESYRR